VSGLRAAVIGVGYLGRFHAQKYRDHAGIELVGVVDASPERAAEVAAEVAAQIGAGGEDEGGLEYVAPGETHVAEALEEESEADTIQSVDEREEEPLEEAPAQDAQVEGYAGDGGLDMSEYTCNDCVYANTCPKVGQVTPAECVSFQWKSA
jgi:hypothetical protein